VTAGRRRWFGLAVLALPTLLVTADLSVLFLAVPKLTRALHPSSSELLWITDVYGLLISASLITMGNVGDRIGRRRLLLTGGALFGLASLLAAFSTSAAMLIAARALLGIAGATLAPSSLALITDLFGDPDERQRAIAIWISCFAAGAAVGPLLGGVLLGHFWWGSVFLVNVPVMALLLATGPSLLPESRDPEPGAIDPSSVALSLAALLAIVYGVTRTAEDGLDAAAVALLIAGVLIAVAFLRRQRHLEHPLVDVRLFAVPSFSAAFVALLASVFIIGGTDLFIAQYIQLVHGVSPFVTSLWLLPGIVGLIVGSMLAPAAARVVRPGVVIAVSLVVAAAGAGILARLGATTGLGVLVAGTTLIGLGCGPIGALGTDILVSAVAPERAGAASAVSETATELGGALGIALLGSLGMGVYRSTLNGRVPAGADPAIVARSRGTLGGAVDAASGLRAPLHDQLLAAARTSFTHGLAVAAVAAAAVALATALVAALALRHELAPAVEPTGELEPPAG
jgi:DHA2 family multidrug resistance protein-like MFS transporter